MGNSVHEDIVSRTFKKELNLSTFNPFALTYTRNLDRRRRIWNKKKRKEKKYTYIGNEAVY